jgi:hypothetical protein
MRFTHSEASTLREEVPGLEHDFTARNMSASDGYGSEIEGPKSENVGSSASNTLPPNTVLSVLRWDFYTSRKGNFANMTFISTLEDDRPGTWANITAPDNLRISQEINFKNSVTHISYEENAAAKLLLVIVWAIVSKKPGDDLGKF